MSVWRSHGTDIWLTHDLRPSPVDLKLCLLIWPPCLTISLATAPMLPHSTAWTTQSRLCRPAILQPARPCSCRNACPFAGLRGRTAFRPFAATNTQANTPQSDFSRLSQVFKEMNQAPPSVVMQQYVTASCRLFAANVAQSRIIQHKSALLSIALIFVCIMFCIICM